MTPTIDTRTWKMGEYPMPKRPAPSSLKEVIARLEEFHHIEEADYLKRLSRTIGNVIE